MTEDDGGNMDLVPFARATNELLIKLLGPTVEYVGESWREKLEQRAKDNADRVATLAISKLGDRINTAGSVPPRVLKAILEEAPFCDDEVAAEYVSGVLASSRTPGGRDDRGASIISTIGRLSALSLRAHYVLYESARRLYRDKPTELIAKHGYSAVSTFIPFTAYAAGMGGEFSRITLQHALYHLAREDLLAWDRFGPPEFLAEDENMHMSDGIPVEYPAPGLIFTPTQLGVDLYLWSMGRGGEDADEFFGINSQGFEIPGVEIKPGAQTMGSILSKASRAHLLIE